MAHRETLIRGPLDRSSPIVQEAVRRLAGAAPESTIILFGSAARGDMSSDGDLDFLVILPVVENRHAEMVRLREVLSPILFPMDVVVYSDQEVAERGGLKGTVLHQALSEGKVMHRVLWDSSAAG